MNIERLADAGLFCLAYIDFINIVKSVKIIEFNKSLILKTL